MSRSPIPHMTMASLIVDGLFVGGVADAGQHAEEYDAVVNCTPDVPFFDTAASCERLRIPVCDTLAENPTLTPELLREAIAFVSAHLQAGRRVLVHCIAGQQRSPAVVAAYLMVTRSLDVEAAIEFVRSRRTVAFLDERVHFRPSLDAFALANVD